jgi:hypothetical protein
LNTIAKKKELAVRKGISLSSPYSPLEGSRKKAKKKAARVLNKCQTTGVATDDSRFVKKRVSNNRGSDGRFPLCKEESRPETP